MGNSIEKLEIFLVFHNYPNRIGNSAFTGMMLWENCYNHDLIDYQICEYHKTKSGIILYGTEAYVFTQITNNDIMSHFRQSNLLYNLKPTGAAKMIVKYVRYNADRHIIPSIPAIQHDLHHSMGLTKTSFIVEDMKLFMSNYVVVFMFNY